MSDSIMKPSAKISRLLQGIPLPKVVKAHQQFENGSVGNIEAEVRRAVSELPQYQEIRAGMSIAVTGGSRGIDRIAAVTKTVCAMLKEKGAAPFIVPTMGSHGGATAAGQLHILETIGITEESMGVPIRSSMETVNIGALSNGLPLCIDRYAHEADGIVLINRVKPHTSFKGKYESGLMKMMAIGLGKQEGAQNYHRCGFKNMSQIIEEAWNLVLSREKVLFGAALTENPHSKINGVHAIAAADIPAKEAELLRFAYKNLALPFFRTVDVMAVEEIGKNISGTGHDPNVTGRFNNEHFHGEVTTGRLALLRLTEVSGGNANGIGMADFITKELFEKIDIEQTYPNALTSTASPAVKIPMVLPTDKEALLAAVKTACLPDFTKVRLAILKNTKELETIYISENMAAEAALANVQIEGEPQEITFSEEGRLTLSF